MSEIKDIIDKAETIAVAGHIRPDGDCVGACVAMWHYIHHNFPEKSVEVYLEILPERFDFLDPEQSIFSTQLQAESYDLFLAVDSSSSDRLGDAEPFFMQAKRTICIDHHISNENYADMNIVAAGACATCEVLYELMEEDALIPEIATALYVGMICDSGVFRYASTSARTMEIAGKLMQTGIPFPKLIDRCVSERTYTQTRLLGETLLNSSLMLEGKCIVSVISRQMLESHSALTEDIEGIVEQLRVVRGTEVAVLLHEISEEKYKVSLRSKGKVDLSGIALAFGGGGHKNAAGCTLTGSAQDVINRITSQIETQMNVPPGKV